MITDTVHCYYQDLGWRDHFELLQFWVEQWEKQGWKTRVHRLEDARRDRRFGAMVNQCAKLPSVNDRRYSAACFYRWLAFSQVDGAVCDYDVFPLQPFPPQDFGGFACGDANGNPGFIVGSKADFSKITDDLLVYQPVADDVARGAPHVEDMIILIRSVKRFPKSLNIVSQYGNPDWDKLPLCHFSSESINSLRGTGTKKQIVERILQEHEGRLSDAKS